MTPDQALAKLRTLPEDKQIQVLQALSPDERKGILSQLNGPPPPEARTVGNYLKEATHGVGRGLRNDVTGVMQTLRHPLDTYDAMVGQSIDAAKAGAKEFRDTKGAPLTQRAAAAALTGLENAPVIGGMVQHAEEGGTRMASPESVGAAAEGITTFAAPEIVGRGIAKVIPKVTAAPETVRTSTQGMVGAGERQVKPAVLKEAEAAETGRQAAIEASKKNTEATLEAQAKTKAARLKSLTERREAQQEHVGKVEETKDANAEALRAQKKIEPTREKLTTAGRELQAQIETAREKALKVGNEKYSGVNEALNELPADMKDIHDRYQDAVGSIGEGQAEPPILKRLGQSIEKGEALTYKDEQALYSELGKELSKGTLLGTAYHAYDILHEAIGDDMQRIANSQGMGAALTEARAYWKRMKQTFGKPYNPTDAGNVTLEKATGQGVAEEQANRIRLLGSFDPTIPQTVEHIANLRKGVSALGEPKPTREIVKPLPEPPETKPLPAYAEPSNAGNRGASVPYERPEVSTRAIREQLLDRWTSGENQLSKFQIRSLVAGGFGAIAGAVLGHGEGAGIGAIVGTVFGPAMISRLVETQSVREWLTRPPKGELEALQKLPNADRIKLTDGLKKIIPAAQAKGIKVSPLLINAITGAAVAGQNKKRVAAALSPQ